MNEIDFRNWLVNTGHSHKIAGDNVSRVKRIERVLNLCDIDEEYRKDYCNSLLQLFCQNGKNIMMEKFTHHSALPIGKYHMSTYRLAIKKYIKFCKAMNIDT